MKNIERKLPNLPIVYYISGEKNKESILFIHAAFADHTQYDNQVKYFEERYKVITVDLIGHGKSINVNKGDTIENTAVNIKAILDSENISKINLVGISIGAVLIQDFANKYPEMVSTMSCFGTYDINNFDPTIQKQNSKGQVIMMLKAIFSIKWFAKSNKLISAITPKAQETFYNMNIKFPKKSFMYLSTLKNLVNRQDSEKRSYPLLIGCGDKDVPLAITSAKVWHDSEPESLLITITNSGHLVNLDNPMEFNQIIERFIASSN